MGIFGISRGPGNKPGQEEEAIQTLSNRLQHATLSADRKSAVLGLKSFSRQFREPVVQHGLRALLSALGKDSDNAPLVKAVLETLLILFLRAEGASEDSALGWISNQSRVQNGKYPSPLLVERIELDEFSDWIADEMISSDEHIKVLMDILQEHQGFQVRIFSLQLLEAVVAARPERAKDCIINTPLAISTIVSLLDDPNDPIRNETILLLMALVNHNFNIQKLVAFENTFEKIFEIIEEEGGIRGSILVQDCMTLLINLLQYNASNQKFFLETDCVPQLARLIAEPIEDNSYAGENDPIPAAPIIWTDQRLSNMTIALEICESFVDSDNQELTKNQEKLYSSGIFFSVLRLVFSPVMENPIRNTALKVTGAMIADNPELQYQFSQIDVPYMDPSLPVQLQSFDQNIPAPLALLNWTLLVNSVHIFEVRVAALQCLISYLRGNDEAKLAFVTDQVKASKNPNHYFELRQQPKEGSEEEAQGSKDPIAEDGTFKSTPYANIFTILTMYDSDLKLNPYCVWFASVLLVYISQDSPETKSLLIETKIGDADEGEEEMSLIQALSGMLITNLDNPDPRIAIGYLILLTFWLYEDFDAVNDFLSDASMIKAILAFLSKNSTESSDLVHGMCCVLAGVCFEFTTKSSPIPRASLFELITKALGADNYSQKVKQFKENGLFKRFDLEPDSEFEKDSTGLPMLFFIPEYVELVKDNFYRIRKALSRGPDFEPKARISFEVFEELENKNVDLRRELDSLKKISQENEEQSKKDIKRSQEELDIITKSLKSCRSELDETRQSEQVLTTKIEDLSKQLKELHSEKNKCESSLAHYTTEFNKVSKLHGQDEEAIKSLKQKLHDVEALKHKAEDGINKMNRELFNLTKEQKESSAKIASHEKAMKKLKESLEAEVSKYRSQAETAQKINQELKAKLQMTGEKAVDYSLPETKNGSKSRELQLEVSKLEETNDNLMEKLRAAASVVQELRHEKTQLVQSKSSLETELTKAYEDLQALSNVLDEVNELKADGRVSDTEDVSCLKKKLDSVTEEKEVIEKRLSDALKEMEDLKTEFDELSKLKIADADKPRSLSSELSAAESEQIDRLKTELEKSQKYLVEAQQAFEKQKEDLLEQLDDCRNQLEVSDNLQQNAHGKEQIAMHETELEDLKEQLQKKEYDLGLTETRMKHLESNIEILSQSASSSLASFKQSQEDSKKRITELEEIKKELMREMDELNVKHSEDIERQQQELDDLENSNMDLELMNSNLEKNRDELVQKLTKLEKESSQKIQSLSSQIEQLELLVEKTKAERDELDLEYIELEKSTNIISSELQAKDALLQAMNNKGADLAAKDKIVIEIKERLAHAISELGESAQNLRVVSKEKAELQKLNDESKIQVEELKVQITKLEAEISSNTDNLEQTRAEKRKLSSLSTNHNDLKKAYNENVQKTAALEERLAELQESLKSKSSALEENKKIAQESSHAAISEYTERISKLEASILEKQKAHDMEMTGVRSEAQEKMDELLKRTSSLEKELSELKSTDSRATEVTQSLEAEVADKNDELKTCQLERDEKHSQITGLEAEIKSKQAHIEALTTEMGTLRATCDSSKGSEELLRSRIAEVDDQLLVSSERNALGSKEIQDLKTKLADVEQQLSEKEKEIDELQKVPVQREGTDTATPNGEVTALEQRAKELELKLDEATQKSEQLELQCKQAKEVETELQKERSEKESAQNDLYDMMVLYEAQERKLEAYKRRMQAMDVAELSDEA